ncbi:hypothetical protein ABHZ71_07980, partial [Bacteroides thetaiotaomicron]
IQNHYSFVRFAIAILFYTGTLSGAYNLLTLLNIKDRLIDNFDLNCIERKINYAEVNRLLALEKERSYYRLLNMIKY